VIAIDWPPTPTVCEPAQLDAVVAAAMRILANSVVTLALPGHSGRYTLPRSVAARTNDRVPPHRVGPHRVGHYRRLPNDWSPAPGAHPSRGRNPRRALTTPHLGDDGQWIGPPVGCWLDRYELEDFAREVLSFRSPTVSDQAPEWRGLFQQNRLHVLIM
jgi:hypothetical protein